VTLTAIDGAVRLWFLLTLASEALVVADLVMNTPATTVAKWGWSLVVAYTGPIGLVVYLLSCRQPLAGEHAEYVAPLWKQAVGSTIHCVAGDATGIIAGALVGIALASSPRTDSVFEYVAGFLFGLLIFQALFSKIIMGGSYFAAVRRTVLPEWLSMNFLMSGMIPVMSILMHQDPVAMQPGGLRFWGVMSAAILVGAFTAYPVNVWLVAKRLKHGMGSTAVLGRGGEAVARHTAPAGTASRAEIVGMGFASVVALIVGVTLAVQFGTLG
jgi:hypothetical protein